MLFLFYYNIFSIQVNDCFVLFSEMSLKRKQNIDLVKSNYKA